MKTMFALAALVTVLCAVLPTPARGQGGEIVLYVDPYNVGSRLCWFDEWIPRETDFVAVQVVHRGATGATGVRFGLAMSSGLVWAAWFATSDFAITGHPAGSGLTVDYGACLHGDILVAEVVYQVGGSQNCSYLTPVAHGDATSGVIEVTLCDGSVVAGGGRPLTVNLDHCPDPWCLIVPVEETTWGRVKALYGE
jgi:hypothetical protein